jgi:hypothetical protein
VEIGGKNTTVFWKAGFEECMGSKATMDVQKT